MEIINLEYCTTDTGVISALADKPNEAGMSAAQLKASFDAAGTGLKAYVNEKLVPYVNATVNGAIKTNADAIVPLAEDSHTHDNKALLDSYTQTEIDLADAVGKKHAHDNKALLDSFTKTMSELMDEMYAQAKLDAHPVGSIYTSTVSTSPAELFGGTWERIKDTFLLAAGDSYEPGATGGEAEHTLTTNEIPSHRHSYPTLKSNTSSYDAHIASGSTYYWKLDGATAYTSYTGGGAAHNNMPPYLAVYVWKRVA